MDLTAFSAKSIAIDRKEIYRTFHRKITASMMDTAERSRRSLLRVGKKSPSQEEATQELVHTELNAQDCRDASIDGNLD